jgi:hypothetical protein
MTMPRTYTVSSNSAIDLPPSLNTTYDLNIVIPVENLDLTVYFYDDKGILQSEIPIFEPSQIEIINGNYSKIQFQDTKYSYEIFVTVKPNKYETFEEYEKAVSESEVFITPIPFSQAPVFATASIIVGSSTQVLANQGYYVPITVTNNQSIATGTNFQLLVQVNTANYSQINPNCQNIFFYDSSGNILFSWIENVTSSTTSKGTVNIWVNLGNNNINANSSITIYMGIGNSTSVNYLGIKNSSNQILVGANPQYTSTYGQYDNGANVFLFYDNFAGTSLNTNKWVSGTSIPSGASGSITVNNGISLKYSGSTNGNGGVWIYSKQTFTQSQQFIWDTLENLYGSSSSDIRVREYIWQSGQTSIADNNAYSWLYLVVSKDYGYMSGSSYTNQAPVDWLSAYTSYVVPSASSTTNYTFINEEILSSSGLTFSQLSLSRSVQNTNSQSGSNSSSFVLLFQASQDAQSGTTQLNIGWTLVRAYPPNGVMPSTSFGSITQAQNNPTIAYITPQNTGIVYFNFAIQNTSSSAIQFQVYNKTNGYYVINESIPSGAIFPVKAYDNNLVLQQQYEYLITFNPNLAFYTFIIKESL